MGGHEMVQSSLCTPTVLSSSPTKLQPEYIPLTSSFEYGELDPRWRGTRNSHAMSRGCANLETRVNPQAGGCSPSRALATMGRLRDGVWAIHRDPTKRQVIATSLWEDRGNCWLISKMLRLQIHAAGVRSWQLLLSKSGSHNRILDCRHLMVLWAHRLGGGWGSKVSLEWGSHMSSSW